MSAVKLIFKRSSILGKRPTNANLEPGEIGLNTNSVDPGLFFEVNDGNVVKVGPTSVTPIPPTTFPEKGELWYNTQGGTLNIGTSEDNERIWQSIAAPYLGGSSNVVFVAPEFEGSTDSLLNNGQALPYQTITRAILELTKIRLQRTLSGVSAESENSRYTIYYAPSRVTANNGPGTSASGFTLTFSESSEEQPTIEQLQQFNPVTGGIIIPSGISIVGMDLKKCEIRPTYIPTYQNPSYPTASAGIDQPLSAIFKWSGNTYLNNFSIADKVSVRDVYKVTPVSTTNSTAVFYSTRPHGLEYNDLVTVSFSSTVEQQGFAFTNGQYYAKPLDTYSFYLSVNNLDNQDQEDVFIQYVDVPVISSAVLFTVSNQLYSAHRLSSLRNATFSELSDYYTKVQKAFPNYFGGQVTPGSELVGSGEFIIVAPAEDPAPQNLSSNSTKNSSAYLNQVNLRSQYGLCGGDFDGDAVQGFKSIIVNSSTVVSLQNDPAAYEIYTTLSNPETGISEQKWWKLTEATYYSIPLEDRPPSITDVSNEQQLQLLNKTPIPNIRYYYETLKTTDQQDIGLTNIEKDFRHFAFRLREKAYGQLQSIYTVGTAVGVWAFNGGLIALTNSTTNFGSIGFLSEGFYGINTIGGADDNGKGFLFEGIQTPLALNFSQAQDDLNKQIFSLGSRVTKVEVDPNNDDIQLIYLSADFSPCYLLPYSLKSGTAIWLNAGDAVYRAFLATDGGPTVLTSQADPATFAQLRVRASDSTIPIDPTLIPTLGIPYIRRFQDPRNKFERSYSFVLKNTSPVAIAPSVGSVLRLNQSSQAVGSDTIKPNVQFDPGEQGGWGRVFTVDDSVVGGLATSPQFNYSIADKLQDNRYFVLATTSDFSRPWTQEFDNAAGSIVTYSNKNWYAAENNLWDGVYYDTAFNGNVGPLKIPPVENCSPFVTTSPLFKQNIVADAYQGTYGADPYRDLYLDGTYLRGSTIPYTMYGVQSYFDEDDGSTTLGLCLHDIDSGLQTQIISQIDPSSIIQTEQLPSLTSRYRPEIVQFSVLSSISIPNPKKTVSVVSMSQFDSSGQLVKEFFRVVSVNGYIIQAIRLNQLNSFYPSPLPNNGKPEWKIGTVLKVQATNEIPDPQTYDPYWANTKLAVSRFFEIMGYKANTVQPLLKPQYWGERFIPVNAITSAPLDEGYAEITSQWPIEFNSPSFIQSNTHTWSYAGYYNYSRGLPEYQTTLLSRKLSIDYQASALWGGKLAVTGINDQGEIVMFGPQREATTGRYYEQFSPQINVANQQIYEQQVFVDFPNQVIVYSTDDISSQFNGDTIAFQLTRGGLAIPPNQLNQTSVFVQLGAVTQAPGRDYTIANNIITFKDPPLSGSTCDIRVVTSEDNEKTLTVVPLALNEPFDGIRNVFTATYLEIEKVNLDEKNIFIFLGGVEQIPTDAYYVAKVATNLLQITFTEPPAASSTIDIRAICTASYWSSRLVYPVVVYSLSSLTSQFDGARTQFELTYNGELVNPETVNTYNLFVSLGGAMQLPVSAYSVEGSSIIFTEPPASGSTINLRVVTNAEYLTYRQFTIQESSYLRWGPGIILGVANQVETLDSGSLIG